MTEFKICGLRSLDHALAAAAAGASMLGFVFVEGVRRRVNPDAAAEIIAELRRARGPDCPRVVGLFANQPLRHVNRIAAQCRLDFAQLCGDEPPEYWDCVDAWVMRQVKVNDELPLAAAAADALRQVDRAAYGLHLALLDKRVSGALGGTGHSFDWRIASEVAKRHPIYLAGGLTPQNVRQAIASARPWGVDVSTGVETGGVKDTAKIAAFAAAARAAG